MYCLMCLTVIGCTPSLSLISAMMTFCTWVGHLKFSLHECSRALYILSQGALQVDACWSACFCVESGSKDHN